MQVTEGSAISRIKSQCCTHGIVVTVNFIIQGVKTITLCQIIEMNQIHETSQEEEILSRADPHSS